MRPMNIVRTTIVLDAPDLEAESSFWAAMYGGTVERDVDWHSVIVDGRSTLGIQLAQTIYRRSGRSGSSSSRSISTSTSPTSPRPTPKRRGWALVCCRRLTSGRRQASSSTPTPRATRSACAGAEAGLIAHAVSRGVIRSGHARTHC